MSVVSGLYRRNTVRFPSLLHVLQLVPVAVEVTTPSNRIHQSGAVSSKPVALEPHSYWCEDPRGSRKPRTSDC